jgi:hypothetical protein
MLMPGQICMREAAAKYGYTYDSMRVMVTQHWKRDFPPC